MPSRPEGRTGRHILDSWVDATSYDDAISLVLEWANGLVGRYVCICNVHMVMESVDDSSFRDIVNGADLVTPDGMPLVWSLRLLGLGSASRVRGPELTPRLCEHAAENGVSVGFYGGAPTVIGKMRSVLLSAYPQLQIAYAYSPPFRPLTEAEENEVLSDIVESGVRLLFVGLGCPKQERWMAAHASRLPVVMLGVGAAFDFLAGEKPHAPIWMQRAGLEWLFRLITEPRRLWRRYLWHNPRFIWRFGKQYATYKLTTK